MNEEPTLSKEIRLKHLNNMLKGACSMDRLYDNSVDKPTEIDCDIASICENMEGALYGRELKRRILKLITIIGDTQ